MRKSTVTMMAILMVCFGTLLVAAGVLAKPMKEDAELARDLTKLLLYQQVIVEDTKVFVFRRPASKDKTLAKEGRGVIVRLCPADSVRKRRGGIRTILSRITGQVRDTYGTRLDWIEYQLESALEPEAEPRRTLVVRNPDGGYSDPRPAK